MKKSPVYTRTGDTGTTSLVSGTRVPKNSPRLEAYGTVDELNSHIGLLASYAEALPPGTAETLMRVQNRLFDLGALLATEPDSVWQPAQITDQHIMQLESEIDHIDSTLPRHNRFVLPGGHPASAQAHVCRTVARRAERRMLAVDPTATDGTPAAHATDSQGHETACSQTDNIARAIRYINRLSDYLFVLARQINNFNKIDEIFWQKDC